MKKPHATTSLYIRTKTRHDGVALCLHVDGQAGFSVARVSRGFAVALWRHYQGEGPTITFVPESFEVRFGRVRQRFDSLEYGEFVKHYGTVLTHFRRERIDQGMGWRPIPDVGWLTAETVEYDYDDVHLT